MDQQQLIRLSIRSFLMTATIAELKMELHLGDDFRKKCVQELLDEAQAEKSQELLDEAQAEKSQEDTC